jgi:hypothetical protein
MVVDFAIGNIARTVVPPFSDSMSKVPPSCRTRSRIPLSPTPTGPEDFGGPNPAKKRAEILAYLRDSFTMIDKAIAVTSAENQLQPNKGRYRGPNRLSALTAAVWHISDHYGQLVEYVRMNGIVPPASR